MFDYRSLRVALLGAGTVGAQVARLLLEESDELANRIGARLELVGIAVRDVDAPRDVDLPRELFTTDAERLILGADIVVELMGGLEPARSLVLQAIGSGADVVTANKALLATHGVEIFDLAEQVGAQVAYEAAVAGAIPIIRPLSESLAGDRVERIVAILNGTTNFILDRMDSTGETLEESLAIATELGYAEADPTADIEGYDAAQKAALLASLAFHTTVPLDQVHREGITTVDAAQVDSAKKQGYVVKLVAVCERVPGEDGTERISVRTHPALIDGRHPLAAVHGANNAVFVEAAAAGQLMFYGAGAGGPQTASAVLGDLVAVARRHVVGGPGLVASDHAALPIVPIGDICTSSQITLEVADRAGVLAEIAGVFAANGVSVARLEQSTDPNTGRATLVIGTHAARERALADTVAALSQSSAVVAVASVLRVEGTK
ncbi:homoserine dehydrogenase [Agromyces seonyuensis]|uniref:Homoserine dehydrogenase n=1 Tax=Agromyces seonyuensis TaxID=2662446 RepID=A0A6I4P568_9MICO|nr:homoserine dehydrogenase [Agromyces seonyuensis]